LKLTYDIGSVFDIMSTSVRKTNKTTHDEIRTHTYAEDEQLGNMYIEPMKFWIC
jgi:hypothetical protein